MRIPPGILENTAAAFALVAFLLSLAGMAASLAVYAASYMALSSVDATVTPQFESAESALSDASESISLAANSSAYAYDAIGSVSYALQEYSNSTAALSSSMSDLASIPPFSLDARFQSASGGLGQASLHFANASASASQMAFSAQAAAASVQGVADDLDASASNLSESKRSFRASLSAIGWLSLLFSLCLLALFSSVALVSLSVMLSHYPNMLSRSQKAAAKKEMPQK